MTKVLWWLGWLCLAALVGGWLCVRFNLVELKPAFTAFSLGFLGSLAVASLLLLVVGYQGIRHGAVDPRNLIMLILAALPAAVFMLTVGIGGLKAPPIHDIVTDPGDPPEFVFAPADRGPEDNSLAYEADRLPAIQRQAYPDVNSLYLPWNTDRVFAVVKALVESRGWRILGESTSPLQLEAVVTTPLFGFKDDVAIRILEAGAGTRVDIRSCSRVGVGDLGANASRIHRFLEDLRGRLSRPGE